MSFTLDGKSIMACDWTLLALAFILVGVRVWFRLRYQVRELNASDIFLLISAGFTFCLVVLFTLIYASGNMTNRAIWEGKTKKTGPISYASTFAYMGGLWFAKFSLLALYFNIIPHTSPYLRRALYATTVFTVLCSLTAILLPLLWCASDIPSNWTPRYKGCTMYNYPFFQAQWSMDITSDVLIFLLPFPLLATLTLSKQHIFGLLLTFGLGLITMGVSIGRFVSTMRVYVQPLYLWSVAETTTALMVASIPALRPLLRKASLVVTNSNRSSAAHRRSYDTPHRMWWGRLFSDPVKGFDTLPDTPVLPRPRFSRNLEDAMKSSLELYGLRSDSGIRFGDDSPRSSITKDTAKYPSRMSVDTFEMAGPHTVPGKIKAWV